MNFDKYEQYNASQKTFNIVNDVIHNINTFRSLAPVTFVEGTSFSPSPSCNIPLHELGAKTTIPLRAFDDSKFDFDKYIGEKIGEKFARMEAHAFILGDGLDKPKGILAHSNEIKAVYPKISNELCCDTFVNLVSALDARYRANASFLMNEKTARAVRKITDSDGRFIWRDGLSALEPARLLGYPVSINPNAPDISENSTPVIFGDFKAGYAIAERPNIRILRDSLSARPNVPFYASKRVGGGVTNFDAITILKCRGK